MTNRYVREANLPISRKRRSRGYIQASFRRLEKESQSATLGVIAIRRKDRILSGHRRCNLRINMLSAPGLLREFESERRRPITFATSLPDSGSLSMSIS